MRYSIAISLGLLSGVTGLAQEQVQEQVQEEAPAQEQVHEPEQHTITSNLEYRLSRGDLPQLSFGVEKPKNVEVIGGAKTS